MRVTLTQLFLDEETSSSSIQRSKKLLPRFINTHEKRVVNRANKLQMEFGQLDDHKTMIIIMMKTRMRIKMIMKMTMTMLMIMTGHSGRSCSTHMTTLDNDERTTYSNQISDRSAAFFSITLTSHRTLHVRLTTATFTIMRRLVVP